MDTIYDVLVIGAGAGGLVVAIGAAKANKKVLLIEKGHYGGDCTNFGCIPSKSLIASAEMSHGFEEAKAYGIGVRCTDFNPNDVLEEVRKTIAKVRQHEEPPALEKIGVKTLTGLAHFISPNTLEVKTTTGPVQVSGKKIVIAAGSHPFIPPIDGLSNTPYLTNETVFELKEIPKRLVVIGAGPIGCELAQSFNRLGSAVTLIASKNGVMAKEDLDVRQFMEKIFTDESIRVLIDGQTQSVTHDGNTFTITIQKNGSTEFLIADQLLISTGRRPNIASLQLDKASIKHTEKTIPVDSFGRTSKKHVFAIGDVVGGALFTHLAENQARCVLTTLLLPFPFKKRLDRNQHTPRCTYTSPEVASIGLTEEQAHKTYGQSKIAIYRVPLDEVDRAITAKKTLGFIKIITKKWSSQILGATLVTPRAGEILPELSLAMLHKIPLRKLARLIHPYPTYNGAIRKAADMWLTQTILSLFKKSR